MTKVAAILKLLFPDIAHLVEIVLTWISLYLFSRAGPAASLRIYFELRGDCEDVGRGPTTIPMGASFFPKELVVLPASCVSINRCFPKLT
jgi:hypothetical protein